MAGLSFDVLRAGRKDLVTLERYHLKDLFAYGRGKDFLLEEI